LCVRDLLFVAHETYNCIFLVKAFRDDIDKI
jgi:hypothetical protein